MNKVMIEHKVIDVSGLSPEQIRIIEEIIANFKLVGQQNHLSQDLKIKKEQEQSLEQLHQEFDWLVADIGAEQSMNRSNIYDAVTVSIFNRYPVKTRYSFAP